MTITQRTVSHVLVTGGGGYVGGVLVPALCRAGHRVTVVDRFFFGRDKLPPESELLQIKELDTRALEVTDFDGVDAVIDLAAISNDPAGELDVELTWAINHRARVRCAHLAAEAGVARYILPSSSSVYGQQEGTLGEESPLAPRTAYAEANRAAELGVLELASADFVVTAVRKATIFGMSPRMRMDLVVHAMTDKALSEKVIPVLGTGEQWRPFVHLDDVARAYLMLLTAPAETVNGQIFNVGGNELNVTVNELARIVSEKTGVVDLVSYGALDDRSHRMSFDKIEQSLGFRPEKDLAFGVVEVADAMRTKAFDPRQTLAYTVAWYQHLMRDDSVNNPAVW